MKKVFGLVLVSVLALSLGLGGCAQKAVSSKEAIETAKTMESVEAQVNYLVKQANAFISSDEFDQAINTAKYILGNLDKESEAAKGIIEKAKDEMQKAAQAAMDDAKSKLGSLGQ